MTLWVTSYRLNRDGSKTELPQQSNLAGVESSRNDFYGSEQHRKLGLKLLPELNEVAVLQVRGASLATLLLEIELLLQELPPGQEGEYWRVRLNNIKAAIGAASSHGEAGCVEIA